MEKIPMEIIEKIHTKYPRLILGCLYDNYTKEYNIIYTNSKLANDKQFDNLTEKLQTEKCKISFIYADSMHKKYKDKTSWEKDMKMLDMILEYTFGIKIKTGLIGSINLETCNYIFEKIRYIIDTSIIHIEITENTSNDFLILDINDNDMIITAIWDMDIWNNEQNRLYGFCKFINQIGGKI